MLRVAGELADGTVTWMAGPRTIGSHIVPAMTAAAAGGAAVRASCSSSFFVAAEHASSARHGEAGCRDRRRHRLGPVRSAETALFGLPRPRIMSLRLSHHHGGADR